MEVDLTHKLEAVAELPGHQDRAWAIAWNPIKPLLATCSADRTVRLYSYSYNNNETSATAPLTFSLHTSIPTGHLKTVRSLSWSPNGISLATGSFDSNIGIWEREEAEDGEDGEWECAVMLEGHETECKSVAWSPGGNYLASCSRDKTVWVWEAQDDSDFECMGVLMEHTQDVKCVAWHPKEDILASASYDDTIKLYLDDPQEDWFCFETLSGHASTVWSLAWSPDGRYFASASDDCTIRLWKRIQEHHWECVHVIKDAHSRTIYTVTWGPRSGKSLGWLASAGGDGRINVYELEEEEGAGEKTAPRCTLISRLENAHGVADVNAVSWCPREGHRDFLASVGDDGVAKVWKIVRT